MADLSFISLTAILDKLLDLIKDDSPMLLLVKPQFEAGKHEVDKGKGVIRDPEVWNDVLNKVQMSVRGNKAAIIEGMVSPITGAEGNVEFFIHVVKSSDCQQLEVSSLIQEAIGLHGDGKK